MRSGTNCICHNCRARLDMLQEQHVQPDIMERTHSSLPSQPAQNNDGEHRQSVVIANRPPKTTG